MRTIKIDEQDADDLITAIGMRICQIETGTTTMRAVDAETYNKTWMPRIKNGTRHRIGPVFVPNPESKVEIRALTREQRDLVNRLEDLISELRKS